MLLRRLVDTFRSQAALPPDVRSALLNALLAPVASLAAGAVACTATAVTVAAIAGDFLLFQVSLAIATVGALRVFGTMRYRRRSPTRGGSRLRGLVHDLGAVTFAGLLGLLCFLTVTRTGNHELFLMVSTTTAGYAAAIAARNAGRPFMAIAQVLVAILPLVAALFLQGGVVPVILGLVILLFVFGMIDITLGIRDVMLEALLRKREQAALARRFEDQARQFDVALNNMAHGLSMFDADGRLQVWNGRFVALLGLDDAGLAVGDRAAHVMRRAIRAGACSISGLRQMRAALDTSPDAGQQMFPSGRGRTLAVSRERMANGGVVIGLDDVTDRLAAQARLAYLACFDDLTGLANRAALRERLQGARRGGRPLAIHLIDLDRFKTVNDTLGHPVGDALIRAVADRLRRVVRSIDLIARLGGDEFVIMQEGTADDDDATDLAGRVIEHLSRPFVVEGNRIDVGASIGIALAPAHGVEPDDLLKNADLALYSVKARGGAGYAIFSGEMQVRAEARRITEIAIREAIDLERFALQFQPIIDLATGRVTACEALLRWPTEPDGTTRALGPGELIAVAEETGLIVEVGAWVLKRACLEARRWPGGVRVAVNLSPVQFRDASLPLHVALALAGAGLPAERLDLEVTESLLLERSRHLDETIADLRALGTTLSLDDFGTGYSSLAYLQKYPFAKLKIDQSFVRAIAGDPGAVEIIGAVAGLGSRLGLRVVAEGIETPEQFRAVRRQGCHEGQGFLFGRPMSGDRIAAFLHAADAAASAARPAA